MKKIYFPILFLLLLFSACTNADPKKMANALCDCVKSKKQVSSKAKKIILKAAKSDDFQGTLEQELGKIDDADERQEVQDDINNVAMAFQGAKTKQCAEDVDKKYRVNKSDEAEMQKKLVDEMQNVDDCEVYAAFVKAGLKKQHKIPTDDSATPDDENDKPKKEAKNEDEE